ncbi:MAG: methyltransferase domain-containing protein [Gemmatimonadota bacterium]|nr:methyltransferase domain-containing protein [Gemmatimonadota bacterium]
MPERESSAREDVSRAYRERIYGSYNSARHEAWAPETLAQLEARSPYFHRLIARHFPASRDARILDLGCGYGALVFFARRAGYARCIGVDGSAEQVAAATRLGIAGVELGDVMATLDRLESASQDVVLALDLIEHFRRDELLMLVDEVFRVLAPGGRWIIHTVNGESPLFGRIRYGDLTHEEAFTRTSIGQLLLSSGFTRVDCFEDTPIVHGAMSAARFVLWKVMRGLLRLYLAAETGISDRTPIFTQNFLTVAMR